MTIEAEFDRRRWLRFAAGAAGLPMLAGAAEESSRESEQDPKAASPLRPMTAHNNLHAVLFQSTSAEYVALCIQTYQLARHALLERLAEKDVRNPAVILDLDETVFDNGPYQAWQIQAGTNFEEKTSWRAWCDEGSATAVPGAVEFIRFAVAQGVTPVFITSRENVTRKGTAANLHKLGLLTEAELAFENDERANHALQTRLFMKGMPRIELAGSEGNHTFDLSNKYHQRIFCEQSRGFELVLSIGDNLSDYAEYYGRVLDSNGGFVPRSHPTTASRRASVLQDARLFGRDFILIPNVTYGGWLRAFEANGLGASDELAYTPKPVREPLKEPQEPFSYGDSQTAKAAGPKFAINQLSIWGGPPEPL